MVSELLWIYWVSRYGRIIYQSSRGHEAPEGAQIYNYHKLPLLANQYIPGEDGDVHIYYIYFIQFLLKHILE